jgi:cytochrome P450
LRDEYRKELNVQKLPPLLGMLFFGKPLLSINSCELLTDLYVHKNMFATKSTEGMDIYYKTMGHATIFSQTQDPKYALKRKELSGAFFKSRLIPMMEIIKSVTLEEISALQDKITNGGQIFNMTDFARDLQARIIVNVSIGQEASRKKVAYEDKHGQILQISIADCMTNLLHDTLDRFFTPLNILFPEAHKYFIMPACRRYARNVDRLMALF